MSSRSDQEQVRLEAIEELRRVGVDPYPAEEWPVTHRAEDLLGSFVDERHDPESEGSQPIVATIGGRITSKRVMGKAAFFHLQDASGQIQVYLRRDDFPEGFYNQVFKRLI